MHKRVAQTLRYLARLLNEQTARTDAAEGSVALRGRRQGPGKCWERLRSRQLMLRPRIDVGRSASA